VCLAHFAARRTNAMVTYLQLYYEGVKTE